MSIFLILNSLLLDAGHSLTTDETSYNPTEFWDRLLVSELAQMLNHHPIININWDKVTIELYTWALNNSISDFDLRSAIL